MGKSKSKEDDVKKPVPGGNQTLNLIITKRVFHRCATTAAPAKAYLKFSLHRCQRSRQPTASGTGQWASL